MCAAAEGPDGPTGAAGHLAPTVTVRFERQRQARLSNL